MSLCQGWWRHLRQSEFKAPRGFSSAGVPEEAEWGALPGSKASRRGKAKLRPEAPPRALAAAGPGPGARSCDPVVTRFEKALHKLSTNGIIHSVSHCVLEAAGSGESA